MTDDFTTIREALYLVNGESISSRQQAAFADALAAVKSVEARIKELQKKEDVLLAQFDAATQSYQARIAELEGEKDALAFEIDGDDYHKGLRREAAFAHQVAGTWQEMCRNERKYREIAEAENTRLRGALERLRNGEGCAPLLRGHVQNDLELRDDAQEGTP